MYFADIEYYLSDDADEVGTVGCSSRGTTNESIESSSADVIDGGSAIV